MTYLVPLIFPMQVEIARLDTAAVAEDPAGTGPPGLGYDDEFREPVRVPPADPESSERAPVRRIETLVRLNAQIEDESFEVLQMFPTGRSPRALLRVVLHMAELESAGLLDDDRLPLLRVNDRLEAVYYSDGSLAQRFPDPPGLYCTEAQPRSFGLGGERSLFLMTFEARERAVQG
jgi:hypothetical protein